MTKRGYKFQEFVAHSGDVNCLNIGKKSCRIFATGGGDRVVNLWGFEKSKSLLSLSGHTTSVQSVTFDSAEALVLAGASNGTIRLWNLEEGKSIKTVAGHRSSCTSVEFHPFGEFFASGSTDTDLKIWDIRKKGSIHTYKGHTGGIRIIRFTPDGRWVVTGGDDNVVKLWDLTAGKLLHDFKFHKGMINCIDFHPHEFLLATGSADRTVKFWDLETFELIGSSDPEASGIQSIIFHPDGKTLFCALNEFLKVISWEPILCHDDVEMGWPLLADLIIYEGKLLGCSYHQSRVGVWVTDLSLIRPYAIGSGISKNGQMEPIQSLMENLSTGLIEHGTKRSSPVVSRSLPISSNEHIQNPSHEADPIFSASISLTLKGLKSRSLAGSQSARRKSDSQFPSKLNLSSARTLKKTISNLSSRDISPSPRRSAAMDFKDTKKCHGDRETTASPHRLNLNVNYDGKSSDSESRSVGMAFGSSGIGRVTEKFERMESFRMPSTARTYESEELASSSNGDATVKYVRGVAVQLGKTRSLVERFERRESISPAAVNSFETKGPIAVGSVMDIQSEYNSIYNHITQNHDAFINSLKSRVTKLQAVRHCSECDGIKGAINAVVKLPDHSVQVDLVCVLRGKVDLFTLDLFSCLLPLLIGLLNSKTERHATVSLQMLLELVKIFGPLVSSIISAAPSFAGVNLNAEERFQRSKQCQNHLERIQQTLPLLIRRGGLLARHAGELIAVFQTFDFKG